MATFLVFRLRLTGQPWSDSLATVIATAAESAKWDDDQLTITKIELDSCFISLQKKKLVEYGMRRLKEQDADS